ncbi:methyl-accepting chemotaxis sensory transducer [Ruminiclostridium papyrosolvens DSM 2782]|uniref:Methyl-accepting chemotaxis sensory transducer n=1 Tax=Ruminiclostridium papyrosolvens DSM 2782 TaxID=588581 RepID=F1T7I2_9FIRM|nr:methyl-accepting chemotaxis protein [Ruminiclostridium papyrosolvens]EGD49430.1 methyl-accepting chemotaxis sensory transducer [Ruminiclostridium papyrosolvens DSM 2782]WES33442.1 methyl-accepting chemotaxis protein [Ruminiclostridium papyrosolvens DSM 2782]
MPLTLRFKLFLSFGIISAVLIGLGVYAYASVGQMYKNDTEFDNMWLTTVEGAHKIDTLSYEYKTNEYRFMLYKSAYADKMAFEKFEKEMSNIETEAQKIITSNRTSSVRTEYAKKWEQIEILWEHYINASRKVVDNTKQNNFTEGINLLFADKSNEAYDNLRNATDALVNYNREQVAKAGETHHEDYKDLIEVLLIYLTVSLGIIIIMVLYSCTVLSGPISGLEEVSRAVADGDLTIRAEIESNDKLGQLAEAFNSMIKRLRVLMLQIGESSQHLSALSEELTSSSQKSSDVMEKIELTSRNVALSTDRQLLSIKEVFDSISQVSAGLNQISVSSQNVTELARASAVAANNGMVRVNAVAEQMKEIDSTISNTAEVIKNLNLKSNEICKIIDIISDITDQTNLLSLNAAIEAAHTGECSKGFSVVADEIKNLSKQCKVSASQIRSLILSIREETKNAVTAISKGTAKVAEGLEKSLQVSQVFEEIQQSVENVDTQILEVFSATKQITAESNNIVKTIDIVEKTAEQINNTCQENTVTTHEQTKELERISSNTQLLLKSMEDLNAVISQFKTQ